MLRLQGMNLGVRMALVLAAASLALGCADTNGDSDSGRARSPNNAVTNNNQGIGPSGGVGPAPRDMPGGGRGSATTPHGKSGL